MLVLSIFLFYSKSSYAVADSRSTIVRDSTGQIFERVPQRAQTSSPWIVTPCMTRIASSVVSGSKSLLFISLVFIGQTEVQIPHPTHFLDWTIFYFSYLPLPLIVTLRYPENCQTTGLSHMKL